MILQRQFTAALMAALLLGQTAFAKALPQTALATDSCYHASPFNDQALAAMALSALQTLHPQRTFYALMQHRTERIERVGYNPWWLTHAFIHLRDRSFKGIPVDALTDDGGAVWKERMWWAALNATDPDQERKRFLDQVRKDMGGWLTWVSLIGPRGGSADFFLTLLMDGSVGGTVHTDPVADHYLAANGLIYTLQAQLGEEGFDSKYRGNLALGRTRKFLEERGDRASMLMIMMTNNADGGQLVSLKNLKDIREERDAYWDRHQRDSRYWVPIIIDGARLQENVFGGLTLEKGTPPNDREIRHRLQEIIEQADGLTMGLKKGSLVQVGGILGLHSRKTFDALVERTLKRENVPATIVQEWKNRGPSLSLENDGKALELLGTALQKIAAHAKRGEKFLNAAAYLDTNHSSLSVEDLGVLTPGWQRGWSAHFLTHRFLQVRQFTQDLVSAGVPIECVGAHSIFLNVRAILPNVPEAQYPAVLLSTLLYILGGVRGLFDSTSHRLRIAISRQKLTRQDLRYMTLVIQEVVRLGPQFRSGVARITSSPADAKPMFSDRFRLLEGDALARILKTANARVLMDALPKERRLALQKKERGQDGEHPWSLTEWMPLLNGASTGSQAFAYFRSRVQERLKEYVTLSDIFSSPSPLLSREVLNATWGEKGYVHVVIDADESSIEESALKRLREMNKPLVLEIHRPLDGETLPLLRFADVLIVHPAAHERPVRFPAGLVAFTEVSGFNLPDRNPWRDTFMTQALRHWGYPDRWNVSVLSLLSLLDRLIHKSLPGVNGDAPVMTQLRRLLSYKTDYSSHTNGVPNLNILKTST